MTLRIALALVATYALAVPRAATACGGCFSPPPQGSTSQLIVQSAERVLFGRDDATGETIVWVEIKYSGLAKDFGWVLPLEKKPGVGVGTSYVFDRLDNRMAPVYRTKSDPTQESCASRSVSSGGIGCGGASSDSAGASAAKYYEPGPGDRRKGDGPKVLEHSQAGPYDYYIIVAGESPDAAGDLYAWLTKNGWDIPGGAKPVVADHVKKGDVFLALKLLPDAAVSEIKPVALTMQGADPCVPLRLTAIAAQDDMTVVVTLAGPGRAVPKTYLHVVPNPLRVDWVGGAQNYQSLLSEAIDAAQGRAFVTEFAGPAAPLGLPEAATMDATLSAIEKTKTLGAALLAMQAASFPLASDVAAILAKWGPEAGKKDPAAWYASYASGRQQITSSFAIDGAMLAADLRAEFVEPVKQAHGLMLKAKTASRLVMRISPAEMTKDPIFAFNPSLPDVSNVHEATLNNVCRSGYFPADALRLKIDALGSWIVSDKPTAGVDPRFKTAPAALRVELLDEMGPAIALDPTDVPLVDSAIAMAKPGGPSLPAGFTLKASPAAWKPPPSDPPPPLAVADSANCDARGNERDAPLGIYALLALALGAFIALRLRRRV